MDRLPSNRFAETLGETHQQASELLLGAAICTAVAALLVPLAILGVHEWQVRRSVERDRRELARRDEVRRRLASRRSEA